MTRAPSVPAWQQPAPEVANDPAGRWVLVSAILASSMVFIDGTALSIALPAMQKTLRATGTDLLWVTNGFSLPLAALLLLGGSLGDVVGRRRIFITGIIVFAIASLACGLAPTIPTLIGARVMQGIGGALMIPGALAMISTFYAPAARGRAIGTWSACSVLATALGPVLGGLFARIGWWRGVFFICLPLAAVALFILWSKTPPHRVDGQQRRVDWWGAATLSFGLATLNYGLIQSSQNRAGLVQQTPFLITGLITLIVFVGLQQRVREPLLPLDVFKSRTLTVASLVSLLFFIAFHGLLFFFPLNLIQVQRYDPAVAGLTQLPLMLLLIVLSPVAGRLIDRHGPGIPLVMGPLIAGVGFWWLGVPGMTTGPREFTVSFLPGLLLAGAGLGLTAAPLSTTVMLSLSAERLGLASGINSTLSRLAGVLAIALLGPVAMITFANSLQAKTASLPLTAQVRAQLSQDSVKLAETRPPSGLDANTSAEVTSAVRLAFVEAFRFIARLTAVMSWLAALVGATLLRPDRSSLVRRP